MAADVPSLGTGVASGSSGSGSQSGGNAIPRTTKRRPELDFDDDGEGNSKYLRCDDDQLPNDKERFARSDDEQSSADKERLAR
uniref:Uncharacterized protein n=2 Tax=Sphaerodactylus townsendi TaxID=933632 RepID=A0ACB8G900_9SAUR